MKKYRLGVIGAGKMGTAIAKGMVFAGTNAEEIALFTRSEQKRENFAKEGFAISTDYVKMFDESDIILLAVKPQNFDEVLGNLKNAKSKPLVLSIAAGVTFEKMQNALGENCHIIRAMPNTPLLLGKGATQLVRNNKVTDEEYEAVNNIFSSMGITVKLDNEDMLNEVIPFAGSAPAYIYSFTEGMIKSAEKHGVSREDALKLFCQTLIGSAEMMLKGDKTPEELINDVCSPGGATIEAMKVFDEKNMHEILAEANDKCIARAYELGKNM